MSWQDILAPLIASPGTRQSDRDDPHLAPGHAPLDGRSTTELLLAARALAGQLRYYGFRPDQADGTWSDYVAPPDQDERPDAHRARLQALLDRDDGEVAPHLALLLAFLQLARHPRALLDDFTRQHLNFQFQTVLGFAAQPARPDHAHVLVALKRGAAPLAIGPADRLDGGKKGLSYRPVRQVVVNQASIARLCAVSRQQGRLGFAPVADSANGLGQPLPAQKPDWSPFGLSPAGVAALPDAPVGFAFAAAVLRMAEGERQVSLSLVLDGIDPQAHTGAVLAAAFSARLSGPKGWLGPFALDATHTSVSGKIWATRVVVPADQAAIVDAQPDKLGQPFPAGLPVIQLLLRDSAQFDLLAGLRLRQASLSVQVSGLRGLKLENDFGPLDPTKPFLPFGAQPSAGSGFHVGCAEALGKRLTQLSLDLSWQNAPATQAGLNAIYAHYSNQASLATGVKAEAVWADTHGLRSPRVTLVPPAGDGKSVLNLSPKPGPASPGAARKPSMRSLLRRADSAAMRRKVAYQQRQSPMQADDESSAAAPRAGFVTLTLETDLLHAAYRSELVAGLLAVPPITLGEPWTPKLQAVSLGYSARAATALLDDERPESLTDAELEFFHVDAFGVAREHLWLSRQRPWADPGLPTLLPPHPAAGELLIGLTGLGDHPGGAALNLLVQVSEGSANPLATAQTLAWSVLADNAWKPLARGTDLTLDSSRDLRTSGLVQCVLPIETDTDNSRMPPGLVWLRAEIAAQPDAVCRLLGIHPNAVEVVCETTGPAASHLASALPAASITRFLVPPAGVKAVSQPYASFGGALQEDDTALSRRAAERLRHRGRAVSAWDHERLVLQAFPMVDRVKCIPHASARSWFAPGHVMLVVVPDLRQRNAVDPLQPRIDLDTLVQIRRHLLARAPMGLTETTLSVCNPRYQPVLLDFKLKMRPSHPFSHWRQAINAALVRALSPWAFDSAHPLHFGGRVNRSALVDFIERLEGVDYVTDFRLTLASDPALDLPELAPDAPDVILVSAPEHKIEEAR